MESIYPWMGEGQNPFNMKKIIFISMFILLVCDQKQTNFHEASFVADTHNDVLLRSMTGRNILTDLPESHSDLVKFKKGGVDLQVFSIWVSPYEFGEGEYYNRANAMISQLDSICKQVPKQWAIPLTYQDILYNEQHNILSCAIGVEGGHSIENSLEKLEALQKRGMRYLGLTWNNSTDWATSAKDETLNKNKLSFVGLTDFGKDVVMRCNQLGVIVDISHAGEQTFWDVLEITTKPIIASHSSVDALCPHYRNLTDDQLLGIKNNGGVVFVNFYPGYIDSTYEKKAAVVKATFKEKSDSLAQLYDTDGDEFWYKENEMMNSALQKVVPDVNTVIDHIDYIVALIGADHVGIGADWDGVGILPKGIGDITKMPVITEILLERGYSKKDVQKILGGNFKRIFKNVVG